MPQKDPVVFAGDGFDRIRESDRVSELVVNRIARQPAESRRRSPGAIGMRITSSRDGSRSAASRIARPSHYGCRRH